MQNLVRDGSSYRLDGNYDGASFDPIFLNPSLDNIRIATTATVEWTMSAIDKVKDNTAVWRTAPAAVDNVTTLNQPLTGVRLAGATADYEILANFY